jgi:hypothetical protein
MTLSGPSNSLQAILTVVSRFYTYFDIYTTQYFVVRRKDLKVVLQGTGLKTACLYFHVCEVCKTVLKQLKLSMSRIFPIFQFLINFTL